MPDIEKYRQWAEQLAKDPLDEHLSDHPSFKGLKYIALGGDARDQIVQAIRELCDWVEHPKGGVVMARMGAKGFIVEG